MSIGQNIKTMREQRGWSQYDLADLLHVSRPAVTLWEQGKTVPRMGIVEDMARLFGVKKSDILDDAAKVPESQDEERLLVAYRSLTFEKQQAVITIVEGMAKR